MQNFDAIQLMTSLQVFFGLGGLQHWLFPNLGTRKYNFSLLLFSM